MQQPCALAARGVLVDRAFADSDQASPYWRSTASAAVCCPRCRNRKKNASSTGGRSGLFAPSTSPTRLSSRQPSPIPSPTSTSASFLVFPSPSSSNDHNTHRIRRRRPPPPLPPSPPLTQSPARPGVPVRLSLPLRSPRRHTATSMLLTLVVVLLFASLGVVQPADAAFVSFQNCLADNYLDNDPVLLQWVPLYVDASFDAKNASHNLVVTLYGNVTGSLTSSDLPPWNSPLWLDNSSTDGKILREPDPTSASPKLTTLHSKIDVLTYEPWNDDTDLCEQSLTNASCPLGPVFNTSVVPYYDLPSISMSNKFYSTYAFTSFSATFLIRYGDDAATTIGCVSATVTPTLGNVAWVIRFLPLLVLLAVGCATIFAGVYSPWGTTDIFHWSSNYGRDPDLLRLVTPGFGDCLQYLQFAVLTGGLTLSYPGFYQPIVSQVSWSTLMFNQSFVSHDGAVPGVVDGIYATNGTYGLQNLAQLVGMGRVEDVWAGMMVWLLVIIAAVLVLFQLGFGVQWLYRFARKIPEEDLRSKNFPFSVGNVIRLVFGYFLLPLVALSTFQFVVATDSPAYTVALAAITLAAIIGFAAWLLYLIISTRPRAVLFDDLPTLLLYGPLYNTYSDEGAAYAMMPFLLTLVRGIAIGAVQPAGIAQIVLLVICEVIQILTLHAFLPFHRQSSMNAYSTLFATLRLVTIALMIAFVPTLDATEGTKGWIGYVILVIHAGVLVLGFFLNAVQTMLEVVARMAGAGGDDVTGQTRGGLSKIFGMRQLSRRMPRRVAGAVSRQSQLSSAAMLGGEDETNKSGGYVMPGGRLRSESAGSIGVLMTGKPGQRSSSALDNFSVDGAQVTTPGRNFESYTPTTTGDMSNLSYLPSPNPNRNRSSSGAGIAVDTAGSGLFVGKPVPGETADPYYRPPRRTRRPTVNQDDASSPAERTRGSWASGEWPQGKPTPGGIGGPSPPPPRGTPLAGVTPPPAAPAPVASAAAAAAPTSDPANFDGQLSRGATPAPYAQPTSILSPRTDYSTREVDFYYGVRGQRLNSEAPGRKLGTGPADPTGPMASAAGWLRTFLGGKSKEKGKGFEVLRSSRMPPAMVARGGDFDDEGPPPGVPVAMDVIRNGPIESDDEDDNQASKRRNRQNNRSEPGGNANPGAAELLDEEGNPSEESETADEEADEPGFLHVSDAPPMLPGIDAGGSIHMPSRLPSRAQSKASRLPSRNQSQASRYGAGDGNGRSTVPTVPTVPDMSEVPDVPRKSSKRLSHDGSRGTSSSHSPPLEAQTAIPDHLPERQRQYQDQQFLVPTDGAGATGGTRTDDEGNVSRLPFERSNSVQGRLSENSSNVATTEEFSQIDLNDGSSNAGGGLHDDRPTSFGYVQQGSINRIDPDQHQDLLGSAAEVVDEHR
ncbi:integral membrane protein [Niveomyces insectorum RCEF 264]|uniref:Integral membrane protein n=1 Tax=Niveomyces insectorum RCEF 264 TaxID=1081102 RepID=A0A167M0Q7_9HYPO|nr:integral membrane protein [Niveomyces insectorum RCEF 264]